MSTLVQSKADVSYNFKYVLKLEKKLKAFQEEANGSAPLLQRYYTKEQDFKKVLRDFIHWNDFTLLSGANMVLLCSLVGRYRPMEPHSFLAQCSILVTDKNIIK